MSAVLVSDHDREYTVGLLRGHWLTGRLTADEFEERVSEAWAARYSTDLWRALRWLPVDPPARRRGSGAAALILSGLGSCIMFFTLGFGFPLALPLFVAGWAAGREARRAAPAVLWRGARGRGARNGRHARLPDVRRGLRRDPDLRTRREWRRGTAPVAPSLGWSKLREPRVLGSVSRHPNAAAPAGTCQQRQAARDAEQRERSGRADARVAPVEPVARRRADLHDRRRDLDGGPPGVPRVRRPQVLRDRWCRA